MTPQTPPPSSPAPQPDNATVTETNTTGTSTLIVAETARTIAGRILPWGDPGRTSGGELMFTPKGIRIPTDLTRVKLLRDHSTQPGSTPVGVMTAWETKPDGLYATFAIASTADGDRALIEAREHIRDSFSVEVGDVARRGTQVIDSVLKGVALVPFPAFAAARVNTVTAAATDDSEPAGDLPDEPPTPPAIDSDTDSAASDDSDESDSEMTTTRPAVVPIGLDPTPSKAVALTTASEVAATILAVRNNSAEVHAAELTDITNSANLAATPPAWLGRLWDGVTYQRRIVPLVTSAPLTGWKAVGYRWTTKPTVAAYTGDKADIPSTAPAIEAVEMTAKRWAGGNDIDRKFLDFNDTEFLAAYWAAMAESYAYTTDADLGEFLVDNATPITTPAADIIRAVTIASVEIDNAVHSPATFAIINPADLVTVLDLAELDAPKYMGLSPVADPSKWVTSEFVPAGTVVVGAKPAVTFFELGGSPIRVQAEHIAKGGFDAALFGYTAMLLNRPEALRKITFTATAGSTPTASTLAIASPATLPTQAAGQYAYSMTATGGTTPYTWTVEPTPAAPNGLTVTTAGRLTANLTAGTHTFALKVTDAAAATATQTFSVTIS